MFNGSNFAALLLLATLSLSVSPRPISETSGSENSSSSRLEPPDELLLTTTIYVNDNPNPDASAYIKSPSHQNLAELVDNYLTESLVQDAQDQMPLASSGSSSSDTLETLGQLTQFDDQINSQQQQYQQQHQFNHHSSQDSWRPGDFMPFTDQNVHLGPEFLSLFDELWRMKNVSVAALLRLNYFAPNRKYNLTGQTSSATNTNQYNKTGACAGSKCRISGPIGNLIAPLPATTVNPLALSPTRIVGPPGYRAPPFMSNNPILNNKLIVQQQTGSNINNNLKSGWNELTNRLNGWLSQTRERVNELVFRMTLPLVGKLSKSTSGSGGQRTSISNQMDDDGRPSEPTGIAEPRRVIESDISTTRVRRQAPEMQLDDRSTARQQCVEPDVTTLAQCLHYEKVVSEKLSQSFPANLAAIEDNCRTISFLLGNCWPDHLHYIRIVLASWDESILKTTDFPLPIPLAGSGAATLSNSRQPYPKLQPQSCGVASNVSAAIIERMNWMWLNLCMDKKFRLDYIDNVSCLAKWPNEKAQSSCQTEHRQMQAQMNLYMTNGGDYTNINVKSRPLTKRQALAATTATTTTTEVPSVVIDASVTTPTTNLATASLMSRSLDPSLERELSSKALCCVYDLYLRCVYRWAHKDCSRSGAQFVVNFMSRMGTDDMKYLCNNEPPTSHTPTPINLMTGNHHQRTPKPPGLSGTSGGGGSGGSRRGTIIEKSPFIENNYYCLDPRILNILGNRFGNNHMSIAKPVNGKNRNRNQGSNINHDPSFFGSSDTLVHDSSSGGSSNLLPSGHSPAALILLKLLLAIVVLYKSLI